MLPNWSHFDSAVRIVTTAKSWEGSHSQISFFQPTAWLSITSQEQDLLLHLTFKAFPNSSLQCRTVGNMVGCRSKQIWVLKASFISYAISENYYTFLSEPLCFIYYLPSSSKGDNNASWSCCRDWRDNNTCRASGPVPDSWWLLSFQWSWALQFYHAQFGPNLPSNFLSYLPNTLCASFRFKLCYYPKTLWAFVLTSCLCLFSSFYLKHLFPYIHESKIRSILQVTAQIKFIWTPSLRWQFFFWVPVVLQPFFVVLIMILTQITTLSQALYVVLHCILKWISLSTYLRRTQSVEQP